jgi:hypothetical protein
MTDKKGAKYETSTCFVSPDVSDKYQSSKTSVVRTLGDFYRL